MTIPPFVRRIPVLKTRRNPANIPMCDSVTISNLPTGPMQRLAYLDGKFANYEAMKQAFPKDRILTITVMGNPIADICDCENGDLTAEEAAKWALAKNKHATIYYSIGRRAEIHDAVRTERQATGSTTHVHDFVADWTGDPHCPRWAVACQYLANGRFDMSLCRQHWPGVYNDIIIPIGPLRRRTIRRLTAAFDKRALAGYQWTGKDKIITRNLCAAQTRVNELPN